MSRALAALQCEEASCPSTPLVRPLKLRQPFEQDILRLPERANASANKAASNNGKLKKGKKTIMSFLQEKEIAKK